MVKIIGPVSPQVIKQLADSVDFYQLRGATIGRSMPRAGILAPTPGQRRTQETFAYARFMMRDLNISIVKACESIAGTSGWTWSDAYMQYYFGKVVVTSSGAFTRSPTGVGKERAVIVTAAFFRNDTD